MKKLFAVLTALVILSLTVCPVFADAALPPTEVFLNDWSAVIVAFAVAVILLAAALVVRAIVKKKRGSGGPREKK